MLKEGVTCNSALPLRKRLRGESGLMNSPR
jgi:hypothetical protein